MSTQRYKLESAINSASIESKDSGLEEMNETLRDFELGEKAMQERILVNLAKHLNR